MNVVLKEVFKIVILGINKKDFKGRFLHGWENRMFEAISFFITMITLFIIKLCSIYLDVDFYQKVSEIGFNSFIITLAFFLIEYITLIFFFKRKMNELWIREFLKEHEHKTIVYRFFFYVIMISLLIFWYKTR